jgi:death-on-curing protein
MNWRWLSKASVLAIHGEQLAEHGGSDGIRDDHLLESALSRSEQIALYGNADAANLAAAYAYGIVQNHPFVDGNKRTGFVVAVTFLLLNGYDFTATEKEVVEMFFLLAQGQSGEKELAGWFGRHIVRLSAVPSA